MSHLNENDLNLDDELSKVNFSLYENSIELWRVEQKCRLKLKSIENIENSTIQVNREIKQLENQLQETKLRIDEVKGYIVSMDNIILSFYETLAHLEVEYKKKEFSINKSKNSYDLHLFIRMELWQKEEEQFNNIPEVKALKIANSELNNTKLEYEELLNYHKNLMEEIKKAEKQNNEKLKDVVIEFAKVYVEMLTLNKREENCISLLRKLDTEYNEKLNMKNELLESSKKKVNKMSFWTHTLCPFDSQIIDIKLDSLRFELKPDSKYPYRDFSDIHKLDDEDIIESNNKLKKKVTFHLPSENQISSTNNDILNKCKHVNTNLVKNNIPNNDMDSNSSLIKDDIIVNTNFNDNEILINDHEFDVKTNKRKITEVNSDFEFKKPYKPIQQENQINENSTQIIFPPNTKKNENIHMNVNEHQEEVQSLNLFSNNSDPKDSCLDTDKNVQTKNSLNSVEQSNLKNLSNETSKIFELQSNETSSEPNNTFSGLFLNDVGEQVFQNSANNSFCGSDLSELFENSFDVSQYPNMQFNFSNPFNLNANAASETNLQELNLNNPQLSENDAYQLHKHESLKKMFTSNTSVHETTSSISSYSTEPVRPHFVTSEQFKFNFN